MATKKEHPLVATIQSQGMLDQLAKTMPSSLTPARFARIALTQFRKTPALLKCDEASVLKCLMDSASIGLEPDGRNAHLIPYGRECTLVLDYKGLIELARRSGQVSELGAEVICENDAFKYEVGSTPVHTIDFFKDRGKIIGAWAWCRFKDGGSQCEVMTKSEIEIVRSGSAAGKGGPWVSYWGEMAKKTVFRRLSKWLPLSPEYRDALDLDGDRIIDVTPRGGAASAVEEMITDTTMDAEVVEDDIPMEPKPKKAVKKKAASNGSKVRGASLYINRAWGIDDELVEHLREQHLGDAHWKDKDLPTDKLLSFYEVVVKEMGELPA
jgi:recombination protein RecT